MSGLITFTVPGRPVPAVRMTSRGKWVKQSAKRYLAYKSQVGWTARAKLKAQKLIHGPVRIEVHIYLGKGPYGDIDNYCKSIFDGLNGVLWADDTQVIEMHAYRHMGRPERAEIKVWDLTSGEVAG